MINFSEKLKLLKVEERKFQDTLYLRVRFLHVDEFIDLSYFYNEKDKEKFSNLANAKLGTEYLVDLGFNPESKILKLLDWAVIE